MNTDDYDVIVIGGGPGGSTAATFVAKAGYRVLLLEKEYFPRYQIGESLLPATIQGICSLLGVKEEIESAGFTPKRGGTFVWGKNREPWSFRFEKATNGVIPKAGALQVERSRFDDILLKNSRKNGVEVKEGVLVKEIIEENSRYAGVKYKDNSGETITATSRYIVDASGAKTNFHRCVGERVYSKFFNNVAIFGYFKGGKRLPAPHEGDTFSAAFEQGWIWHIPLTEELTSIGVVVDKETAKQIDDIDCAYEGFINACPAIKELLEPAQRMTDETYGKLRVLKDFSYNNTRFFHKDMILIGDAACFIDPVFSSGVHLSTYAGLLAARSINTALKGTIDKERCFIEFELRYRKEFGNFYNFLMAFYDVGQGQEDYFWAARKILNTEEKSNEAFARLITGFSTEGIGKAASTEEYFTLREGFGAVFKEHIINEAKSGISAQTPNQKTVHSTGIDMDQFMKGFTQEIVDLQLQAKLQQLGLSSDLLPASSAAITVSGDFLHWENRGVTNKSKDKKNGRELA
ncbi:MAG: tryptophan 7-halogenase [Pseudomonadota bacterium]